MPMPAHTQALHWSVLRMLKGILRGYETWLRAETGQHSVTFTPRPNEQPPTPGD